MVAENFNVMRVGRIRFMMLICITALVVLLYSMAAVFIFTFSFSFIQVSPAVGYVCSAIAIPTFIGFAIYAWLKYFRCVLVPRLIDIGFRSPVTYYIVFLLFIPGINVLIFLGMALMPANFVRE